MMPMYIQLTVKMLPALVMLGLSNPVFSQRSSRFTRPDEPGQLAVTAGVGVANYLGDLNERNLFRRGELGLSFAAGISYRLSDHASARAEARVVRLKASQRATSQEANNLSFRSTNPELTGSLLFDLLPASSRPVLNPYVAVGVGFTYLSPVARYQNRWVRLPALDTEGESYSQLAVLASGGVGFSVRLPQRVIVALELTYTLPSSDYVDDVSTVYPYASSLRGNEAIALSDRRPELGLSANDPGNPRGVKRGKDTYLTGLFRVAVPLSSAKERQYRRGVNCIR